MSKTTGTATGSPAGARPRSTINIALDGPAGAGKSTLARRAAARYSFIYIDTGALYRCIGLYVYRKGISPADSEGVISLLPEIKLEMKYDDSGTQRMIMCGEDVTAHIRQPEISSYASDVSAIPAVRDFLLSMQQDMAKKYDVVMDGRDIGTVVLPDAGLKIFITADIRVRAGRRFKELTEQGIGTTLEDVEKEMAIRDKNDSERAVAPLKMADDAILLDTTELDFEGSFKALCGLIEDRFNI